METKTPEPEKTETPTDAADTKIKIVLEFDMLTNSLQLSSKAPTVMTMGIIAMAMSMVTQNQVMQRIQAAANANKIIKPGQH